MVVLQIDGGGYQTAATAFAEGNQLAALAYDRLSGALAGSGGMAGDDSTATGFVAAYDPAAAEALAALGDLVSSFESLGHLTHATLCNHARANARAVVGGTSVYDGGWLPDAGSDSGYVSVLGCSPPTAAGAGALPALPSKIDWILDHVQGFVWPTADTGRLRRAATAWRTAAQALVDVEVCCDSANRGFWLERSPEVPTAIGATSQLKWHVRTLADQLAALGGACEDYAAAVEAKHAEIVHLAEWLLEQLVEGVILSFALGAITAGAGTAAGLSAVTARVASETPRFAAILDALRAAADGYAAVVADARLTLAGTRASLLKYKSASAATSATEKSLAPVEDLARTRQLEWFRLTFEDPKKLDPQDLRGLSRDKLHDILSRWEHHPSSRGKGLVYEDPVHKGRQFRLMDGYPGNRPDPTTHGPYAVVSQNGDATKIALEGNPTL